MIFFQTVGSQFCFRLSRDKTGYDKTKRDKTGHDKAKRDRAEQDKAKRDKTGRDKARRGKTEQNTAKRDKTGQENTIQFSNTLFIPKGAIQFSEAEFMNVMNLNNKNKQ